jgi:ribosomal subunit interface protein
MEIYVTGRGIELTGTLREYVHKRIERAADDLKRVRVTRMEVQLYRTSQREIRFGCHVLLHLSHCNALNVREEDGDLYEAIDKAGGRLARALTEQRDRWLTRTRQSNKPGVARARSGVEHP